MPVTTRKRGNKHRVVKKNSGRIEKTKTGRPRDGGGHRSKAKARRQARAINSR